MTSENFEKIFQLKKDDITKENAKIRGQIIISILSTEESYNSYICEYHFFYSKMF